MRQTGLQDGPISASFSWKVANELAAVPSARSMGGAYEVSQRSLNAGLAASLAIPMISRGARAADTPAEDWSHSID